MRAPPPPRSVPLQGRGGPPPPSSAVRAHAPLFSALLPQRVEPPIQPSAVNPPPLPQLLSVSLQQDVLPLQPLSVRDPPPPLSVLLQGRGKPHLLPLTMRASVPLLSALLLWQGMPLCHPSADPAPLPLILDLIHQRVEPNIQHSDVNPPLLPQLSSLPLAVHTPLPRISDLPLQ